MGQPPSGTATLLAGSLLRFPGLDGEEADREASLYPSQSGAPRVSAASWEVGMEQLPGVGDRKGGQSRGRVPSDGTEARSNRYAAAVW